MIYTIVNIYLQQEIYLIVCLGNSLERIGATLFAITSTEKPNLPALIGYTMNREHVYATESDRDVFFKEMRKATDRCMHVSESLSRNSKTNDAPLQAAMGTYKTEEQRDEKFGLERTCKAGKIDIMIALDSSGSVFNVFEDERKLAHDLIDSLVPVTLKDGRIQVSVMRFASSAEVVIPFKISRTPNEIMEKLDKIKFTGGSTRIAKAVDLALTDLSRWRRNDAIQIFILISDGNGHELWHVAQTAGRKLQNANIEVFAVPVSQDHNLNELILYTGDAKRVYVGAKQSQFVHTISSLINKCVRAEFSRPHVTNVTEPRLNVFESVSTTIVKSKTQITRSMTEMNGETEQELSKKPVTKVEPSGKGNLNLEAFVNSLDDLSSPIEIPNIRGQLMFKADGTPLLSDNKQNAKLSKNLKSELIMNEAVEKQTAANITTKISPPVSYLDLLFAIDLSPYFPANLKNQLKLVTELVNKVTDEDINEERIRIGVVTFTQEARLDLEWGKATTKPQVLQHFESIEYVASNSSAVTGITLATQYAQKSRRSNARLIIILVSDGSSQDLWHSVVQAAKKLHELPETIIYAVTTSKQYKFAELEAFTKDKWKVYVDGRVRRFITDASKHLMKKEGDENDEIIDAGFSPIIESIKAHNDPVDLIILVDTSTPADQDFEVSKKFLAELLRSLQVIDFQSRVRISLTTFTDNAHIEIELRKPTAKENILYAVGKLQNEYSNASVSAAVDVALAQISVPGEGPRQRIFVILTDGSTQDSMQTITTAAAKLRQTDAEVYVVPITENYSKDELSLYVGDQGILITHPKAYKKKFANYAPLNDNNTVVKDFVEIARMDEPFTQIIVTTLFNDQSHVTNKPDMIVKSIAENETRHPLFDFDLSSAEIKSKAQIQDPNCLVDLIFIVDTSQSVEKTFQKQLQFAVTLIKQIPPSAFNNRIRVAAISFSSEAQINFQFNEFNNRTEILNALLSLTHSGGNTSSVSGINLAIKEILERGREDVRRMIVLMSDGNSQDCWEDLLDASDRLHATNTIVYAIAANPDYYFRELEAYTRSKWLVYVDGREGRFLNDATISLLKCQDPSTPIFSLPPRINAEVLTVLSTDADKKLVEEKELIRRKSSIASISGSSCKDDFVDLLFIIDTSTNTENDFNCQKASAMDLIKMIPLEDFLGRLAVAVVKFSETGKVHSGFKKKQTPEDILYDLERLKQIEGKTSLAAGVEAALLEIASNQRPSARLVIVIFSSGNNRDTRQLAQSAALKLRETGGDIYAVTLSKEYELTEYTGNAAKVYIGNRANNFTKDVSNVILNCKVNRKLPVKHVSVGRLDVSSLTGRAISNEMKQGNSSNEGGKKQVNRRRGFTAPLDDKSVESALVAKSLESNRCKYSKMDLEIILDASASRQQVFEHQRELALSLIERLPIDAGETHVAVGINSFTSVPTLRQTLGLGRDKQMVRHAIEDIKYIGGSTFTAQAVELSVQDLERGRRPDAIQVVVLMNDGMSQDPWEKVLEASQLLKATGAKLFGVALGESIDLRELKHYIGSTDRIYRDNSTERFLADVVSLLTGGEDCGIPASVSLENTKTPSADFNSQICSTPNLDIIVLFDNTIKKANLSEQSISSNRYLLLDVLGSLPVTKRSGPVKISVITFNSQPQLVVSMSDLQDRDSIFTKVESIKPEAGKPSYAKAVNFAIQEYNKRHREDARGMLVIVGDGRSEDNSNERDSAIEHLRSAVDLSKYAVDSGKLVDVEVLSKYTGSSNNVFNYDRNAEFARVILNAVEAANKARCVRMSSHDIQFPTVTIDANARSTSERRKLSGKRKKGIASKSDQNLKRFDSKKVVTKEETTAVAGARIPRPSAKSVNRQKIAKEKSVLAVSKAEKQNEALLNGENLKDKQLKEIPGSSRSSKLSTIQIIPSSNFHRQPTSTTFSPNTATIFSPGCEIDVIMLIDSSGSVEKTFSREKELAAEMINRLRIGPKNARVAIVKFAAKEKVKTIWSFDKPQEQQKVLQALQEIPFSSGTTAIHAALLQAVTEYSAAKGARPKLATPFVIVFTDGFGQKDTMEAATLLRNLIPSIFAVAISRQHPVNEEELIKIAGSKDRVFIDNDIRKLFEMLEKITRTC
ncbi:von Willebrand factor domain-containing protein [Loa loa]|uniref:von Willebrand factor domain-containing protein n=1 Tax=Loa loa TaxID=7209 RepID=A0A1S0U3V7_LOALO|nr:von Willebrand factor domain-containing protein [Loa loa]EFO24789.2 von Willebrand factor domain-containing protein [Loa loa]